jgi:hypothetical protein
MQMLRATMDVTFGPLFTYFVLFGRGQNIPSLASNNILKGKFNYIKVDSHTAISASLNRSPDNRSCSDFLVEGCSFRNPSRFGISWTIDAVAYLSYRDNSAKLDNLTKTL